MGDDDLLDILDIPDYMESNFDLAAYADEHPGQTPEADQVRRKSKAGPCYECQKETAALCLRCERPACTRHHLVMYGLCRECASGSKRQENGHPEGLDVPWID